MAAVFGRRLARGFPPGERCVASSRSLLEPNLGVLVSRCACLLFSIPLGALDAPMHVWYPVRASVSSLLAAVLGYNAEWMIAHVAKSLLA
jgi:hypothetical protein